MEKKDFLKTKSFFEKRIDKLIEEQYYFEAIFLMSAILERELQTILRRYEDLICNKLAHEKGRKIKFSIKHLVKKDIRKMPLGEMINYTSMICENKSLLKELNYFNNLRIEVIHGLFEVKSVLRLESKIKRYLRKLKFWKLLVKLSNLEILISKRILFNIQKELSNLKRRLVRKRKKYKKVRRIE